MLENGEIHIYSRNQENNTSKYPDIIARMPKVRESGFVCLFICLFVCLFIYLFIYTYTYTYTNIFGIGPFSLHISMIISIPISVSFFSFFFNSYFLGGGGSGEWG